MMFTLLTVFLSRTSLSAQEVQEESHRKVVQKVAPGYPPIARTLKLAGTVRVEAKVAAGGKVVSTMVLGGHPVLAQAAMEAVRQWRYEAAGQTTNEVAIITFRP